MTDTISISEDELLQSLFSQLDLCEPSHELRRQTDIDSLQFSQHYGISINCARSRMQLLAKQHSEQWQLVKVLDAGHICKVLRKVV
jgi:hypothetical protein